MVDVGLGNRTGKAEETVELSMIVRRRGKNENADFFSRADTSIDLVDKFPADHFEENDAGTRVQHLLVGSPVRLVL